MPGSLTISYAGKGVAWPHTHEQPIAGIHVPYYLTLNISTTIIAINVLVAVLDSPIQSGHFGLTFIF